MQSHIRLCPNVLKSLVWPCVTPKMTFICVVWLIFLFFTLHVQYIILYKICTGIPNRLYLTCSWSSCINLATKFYVTDLIKLTSLEKKQDAKLLRLVSVQNPESHTESRPPPEGLVQNLKCPLTVLPTEHIDEDKHQNNVMDHHVFLSPHLFKRACSE